MIKLEDDKTKYTLGIYEDQLLNFSYVAFGLLPISDPKAAPKCRNVTIIVPYAVGTATDLIFREFGQAINRQSTGSLIKVLNKTHATVIEENMTGAPDGCQLLGITQSLVAKFLLN